MRPQASKISWLKIAVFVLLLALYGFLLLHTIKLPAGDDLARLIKNGETVFQNWDVLTKNVYSYTEPDHAFANHHWLSGIVFYLLHAAIGFGGLVIFKTALLLLAFALLFRLSLRKANFWVVAFFSIPTILMLRERTMVRPEMFSCFFIVLFLYLLMDLEQRPQSKKIFWLIPLQLLWANMHLFFGIGVLMAGGFLCVKLIQERKRLRNNPLIKKLVILVGALAIVSLITPFGINGALYALQVNVLKDFPIDIAENQSVTIYLKNVAPWDDISLAIFRPMIALLALSFILGFRRKEKPLFYFLASIGTVVIGLSLLRAMPFFAIIFLPAISMNVSEAFEALQVKLPLSWRRAGYAFLVLALAGLIYLSSIGKISQYEQFGIGLTPQSNAAADFFKAHNLRGPIYNNADIGSYLIYHLYPSEKVFVDNRFGDAYSATFFRNEYLLPMAKEDAWKALLEKYKFNVIFFNHYDHGPNARDFLYRRMRDPAWALVHADRFSVIFLKNIPENKAVIDKFQITKDNAPERLAYLADSSDINEVIAAADLFNFIDRADLGQSTFLKVVLKWPDSGRIWMLMGLMESSEGESFNPVLSMMYLERAIATGQKTAEAYTYLGYAYFKLGQNQKAEDAIRKALSIDSDYQSAKTGLEALLELKKKSP